MGDYTLSLATALRSLGHSVLVVGLNDRWIDAVSDAANRDNADGVALERLPSALPFAERVDRACVRLKAFRPDWASFQMSCYAYHPKGILFGVNRHLRRLVAIDLKLGEFKPGDMGQMELYLKWLDRYERRAGVWKISYRSEVNDWARSSPAADEWLRQTPTSIRGARGEADPSHALLRGLIP